MAETSLPSTGSSLITIAKTFVTQSKLPPSLSCLLPHSCGFLAGCILLGVGFQGGAVKVYSLTTSLHWTNQFDMTASMATELHSYRESGKISDLLMVPHADGCVVHVCFNSQFSRFLISSSLSPPSLPLSPSSQTHSCTSGL